MSGASTYLTTAVFNQYFVGKQVYLALFTDDPTDANDTSKEVNAAWYGRKQASFGAVKTKDKKELILNDAAVLFSRVVGAPVTVKAWGIYDAETGGNLLFSQTMDEQTLAIGSSFGADAGSLELTFA